MFIAIDSKNEKNFLPKIDLGLLKSNYQELSFVFYFLDFLILELKKKSSKYQNTSTIIFYDYNDTVNTKYFINIDKANEVLTRCYNECFLED